MIKKHYKIIASLIAIFVIPYMGAFAYQSYSKYSMNSKKSMAYSKAIMSIDKKKVSRIPDYYYDNIGCNALVNKYVPSWAPKNNWTIRCQKHVTDNKNIDGMTYQGKHLIVIQDGMKNDTTMHVAFHEWGHATIYEYNMHGTQEWKKWVNYVNHIKGHKVGYYGNPEEVLVENISRCTQGYEYLNTGYNIASCTTIRSLFPIFTTIDPTVGINESLR